MKKILFCLPAFFFVLFAKAQFCGPRAIGIEVDFASVGVTGNYFYSNLFSPGLFFGEYYIVKD